MFIVKLSQSCTMFKVSHNKNVGKRKQESDTTSSLRKSNQASKAKDSM